MFDCYDLYMNEGVMPPSVTNTANGNKNKKKKEKTNVQQVQPQPQKPPSPNTSQFLDEEKSDEPARIVIGDVTDEIDCLQLIDASPPVAPPRHGRVNPPPAAPATRITPICSPALPTTKTIREKTPVIAYHKGQIVKATSVPQSSIVNSVAEFVQENIQQSSSPTVQPEKIEWVQFHSIDKGCNKKCDVILMGLSRGFQVWIKYDNGDFEEVMSERQGPIKSFVFLSPIDRATGLKGEKNPMIAFVDASGPQPDRQFSTVSIYDLYSKKLRLPLNSEPFEETVTGLCASDRYLIVALSSKIFVYETEKFTKVTSFQIATPPEGCQGVCAVNNGLLAYADHTLNTDKQSCGGLEPGPEEPATYTSQTISVLKAITSTVKNIGESVTGATAKGKDSPQGIVTVVNLDEAKEESILNHFVAHFDPLAHLAWSPDGRLLLSADLNGYSFNVFLLMPHPASRSLSTVQHLYRLHRGNTTAKVYCTSFTIDCRWLAVATNHGTTHIFAINPYGGKPTVATHGDDFTNKESRFLRSAGLTESNENISFTPRSRTHSGQIQLNKDHPSLKHRILAKCSGNPRIGPFSPPILLTAMKKIQNSRISTDNLSAWATDLNPVTLPSSKRSRHVEPIRTSLMFSNRQIATKGAFSLLIARADNGVFEYELKPRPIQNESHEKSPELEVISSSMWALQRTKNNPDIPPPLQAGSPLVTFEKEREKPAKTRETWVPQIEITTYSVPSRRLWQGPQFTFYQYSEDLTEVMPPSSDRNNTAAIKCIPIVMGDKSVERDDISGEATRIECGSWVSQNSITMAATGDETDLSLRIADAMKEVRSEGGMRQNSSLDDFAPISPRGARSHSGSGDDELLHFDDI